MGRPDLGALLRDALVLFFLTGLVQPHCLTDASGSLGRLRFACALCSAVVHLSAWKQPETSACYEWGAESAHE